MRRESGQKNASTLLASRFTVTCTTFHVNSSKIFPRYTFLTALWSSHQFEWLILVLFHLAFWPQPVIAAPLDPSHLFRQLISPYINEGCASMENQFPSNEFVGQTAAWVEDYAVFYSYLTQSCSVFFAVVIYIKKILLINVYIIPGKLLQQASTSSIMKLIWT